jgi:zinc and cadmium transporter
MDSLVWIIAGTFLVSLIAFIGIAVVLLKERLLEKILLVLVALSAGAMMGGAFLHLIPEAIEFANPNMFIFILTGFVLFFLVEKIFQWRHCHAAKCTVHSFAYMNLFGDAIHNFIDGLIIAASFVADINLGIVTTLAVVLHEVPQELGDFGVLVYGGFGKAKALFMNFMCALAAVLGSVIGYYLSGYTGLSITFLLPFAAGGFIYISASDLIPELKKEVDMKKSLLGFGVFILGILMMYGLKLIAA